SDPIVRESRGIQATPRLSHYRSEQRSLSLAGAPYLRNTEILPFTVDRLSVRPPEPIVPLSRFGPQRPCTVSGQSVLMLPFTVDASTTMFGLSAPITISIEPFTVSNSSSPAHSARPTAPAVD